MAIKRQTIKLHSAIQANHVNNLVKLALNEPGVWCVEFKKYQEAKTLQQLRALFGVWYAYLSEEFGYSKDELHQIHKIGGSDGVGGWLLDIYREDPANDAQVIFMNGVVLFEDEIKERFSDHMLEAYTDHLSRISLSWATIEQMREYMNRIEQYYINAGYPLPILEKFRTAYIGAKND